MSKPASLLLLQPTEYFHAAVSGAMSELRITASDHACSYLVHLLSRFIAKENLFPADSPDTLAQQLAQALEAGNHAERLQRLRQLGDFSLYIAGFFSDSFTRKLVDVDYYIDMGGAAYESVAILEEQRGQTALFEELARKFPRFVDVLAQISEQSAFQRDDSQALLRMYDLWTKTGSERLAKQLAKAGIMPTTKPDPDEKQ